MDNTKICTKCKIKKNISEFGKRKDRGKDRHRNECKNCQSKYNRLYYLKNIEKHKAQSSNWYKNNPKDAKLSRANWYKNNKDYCKILNLNWRKNNPERDKLIHANWRKNNPEREKLNKSNWNKNNPNYMKEWKKNNPEKVRLHLRKSSKKRRSTLQGKISHLMSSSISKSLHGNKAGRHWEDLVGYTLKDLKNYLELFFWDKMSWEIFTNKKGAIEIHHVILQSSFKYVSPEDPELKKCWALENLIPMWKKDHRELHKKLSRQ